MGKKQLEKWRKGVTDNRGVGPTGERKANLFGLHEKIGRTSTAQRMNPKGALDELVENSKSGMDERSKYAK